MPLTQAAMIPGTAMQRGGEYTRFGRLSLSIAFWMVVRIIEGPTHSFEAMDGFDRRERCNEIGTAKTVDNVRNVGAVTTLSTERYECASKDKYQNSLHLRRKLTMVDAADQVFSSS